MNNIFGNLDDPESHGLANTLNLRIPLKPGRDIMCLEKQLHYLFDLNFNEMRFDEINIDTNFVEYKIIR